MRNSNRPPLPRMTSKPCKRIGRERERREETESEPAQTHRPPSRFPGRTGSGCLSHAGCWQVFRFASTLAFAGFLLSATSQLQRARACRGFVLAYRYGAVPDSHRVPSYSLIMLRGPTRAAVYCGIRYLSTAIVRGTAQYGFISTMSQAKERKSSLSLPGPTSQV
jgi:hypothetical protein